MQTSIHYSSRWCALMTDIHKHEISGVFRAPGWPPSPKQQVALMRIRRRGTWSSAGSGLPILPQNYQQLVLKLQCQSTFFTDFFTFLMDFESVIALTASGRPEIGLDLWESTKNLKFRWSSLKPTLERRENSYAYKWCWGGQAQSIWIQLAAESPTASWWMI